ncbi:MAG: NAD(P)H-dependent oxidoreductase subunit E, partial [Limisphaerales bacterium]
MVERIGKRAEDLIPLLQAIQKRYNWLSPAALERLSQITEITPAAITGVSTFYHQFRHRPVGKHIIKTCVGTACHVKNSAVLDEAFRTQLKVRASEQTDASGDFTVEKVACLGCCMLAPVVQIDDVIYGHVEPWSVPDLLQDVLTADKRSDADRDEVVPLANAAGEARVCLCSSCVASGSRAIYSELRRQATALSLPVAVREVACTGLSFQTPLVEISLSNGRYRYGLVKTGDIRAILLRHFQPVTWLKRAGSRAYQTLEKVFTDESWIPPTRFSVDIRHAPDPFSKSQRRIVTEHAGVLKPHDIDD